MSLIKVTCHGCGTVVSLSGEDIFYMTYYKCPKCLTPMSTWAFTEMKHKHLTLALAARDELSQNVPIYDANVITWELDSQPGESEIETYWRSVMDRENETDENGFF